ncbi:hypothetical protein CRYUN_Cryun13aG0004500 [Craigia yunnanensis]
MFRELFSRFLRSYKNVLSEMRLPLQLLRRFSKVYMRMLQIVCMLVHIFQFWLLFAMFASLLSRRLQVGVIYSDEDRKFNTNITIGLIHKGLLNLAEYNKHMAKLIDAGKNKTATESAISLLETLLVQESSLTLSELPNLIGSLEKLAARPGAPESLQKLVEIAKNPPENAATPSGNIVGKNAREKKSSDHSVTSRDGNVNAESMEVDLAGFYDQLCMA